jgi:hypothetical protein
LSEDILLSNNLNSTPLVLSSSLLGCANNDDVLSMEMRDSTICEMSDYTICDMSESTICVMRVNSTNVLNEGLRIGEIGRRMNSKVRLVKIGVYRK